MRRQDRRERPRLALAISGFVALVYEVTWTRLLTLQLGRVCVRYSISEDTRTLSIEHVIVLEEDDDLLVRSA